MDLQVVWAQISDPLWLTLQLALVTSTILLVICLPLTYWLSFRRPKVRPLIETILSLPLVLPPTVLGFYLLILLGKNGAIGKLWIELTGAPLAFSFTGLVIGSIIYSLPFAWQPMQLAFDSIDRNLLEMGQTLGAGPWKRFQQIILPLAKKGILSATILAFAHTLGEFGVVLMIGGNIPGKTQVLSIAIYEQVETLNYNLAHVMSAILILIAFIILLIVNRLGHRSTLTGGMK
jgi:molybdate transport system permease protein